jgi:hypothetical protein
MRINTDSESSTTAVVRVFCCLLVSLFSALMMVWLPV